MRQRRAVQSRRDACAVRAVNGRTYKSDPTIMAWDLMNEPRCTGCAAAVQTWIATMAAFLKSIDPNHMVGSHGMRASRLGLHMRSTSVFRVPK